MNKKGSLFLTLLLCLTLVILVVPVTAHAVSVLDGFNPNVYGPEGPSYGAIHAIAVQTDGKILIGGHFT